MYEKSENFTLQECDLDSKYVKFQLPPVAYRDYALKREITASNSERVKYFILFQWNNSLEWYFLFGVNF